MALLQVFLRSQKKYFFAKINSVIQNQVYVDYSSDVNKKFMKNLQRLLTTSSYKTDYNQGSPPNSSSLLKIYHGAQIKRVRVVKIVSLTTSVIGIMCQPFIFTSSIQYGIELTIILGVFSALFSIVSPILLHLLTKKYITYIYYDTERDMYIATVYDFFVREQKIEFEPENVELIDHPLATCKIHNKPYHIEENSFLDRDHFVSIMSYDKPVDLKLGCTNNKKKV